MKVGYALITGVFLSVSALFFFRQEEKLYSFIVGEKPPSSQSDDPGKTPQTKGKKEAARRKQKLPGSNDSRQSVHKLLSGLYAVPSVMATKTVDKTSDVVSNDVLTYSVVLSNNSLSTVTDLSFTDNIDPNTMLVSNSVKTSPVAFDDSYDAIGNVGVVVPAADGVLKNDHLGTNPPASFAGVTDAATAQGGTITIGTDGAVNYKPAAGFTGQDSYTYTLSNSVGSSNATITFNISGMVWFVNNKSAASGADGRLNTPFKSVAAFQSVNNGSGLNPKANQNIFIYESDVDYSGNITLLNGQNLIGQDATASLATITGYTGFPYSTPLLPAMNAGNADRTRLTASSATNVITANGGTSGAYFIRGLTVGNRATGSAINGSSFGALSVSETTITGTGQALNLATGTLNATFDGISASGGAEGIVGSSRVDLQACKLEYSIVSPK